MDEGIYGRRQDVVDCDDAHVHVGGSDARAVGGDSGDAEVSDRCVGSNYICLNF